MLVVRGPVIPEGNQHFRLAIPVNIGEPGNIAVGLQDLTTVNAVLVAGTEVRTLPESLARIQNDRPQRELVGGVMIARSVEKQSLVLAVAVQIGELWKLHDWRSQLVGKARLAGLQIEGEQRAL